MKSIISKLKQRFSNLLHLHSFFEKEIDYRMKMQETRIYHNLIFKAPTVSPEIEKQRVSDCQYKDSKGYVHEIIVSLTSYGERVRNVHLTIESILLQNLTPPNRIILWLSEDEFCEESLPGNLKNLRRFGVEIRFCKDIRSYKKLVPTLKIAKDATIITIDDDVIYWEGTCETLIKAHLKNPDKILFLSGSRICFTKDGNIGKYTDFWKQHLDPNVIDNLNFPTGVGGVLYPPHSLDEEVLNEAVFLSICPTADDIWFKAMSLKKGTLCKFIQLPLPVMKYHISVREAQNKTLNSINVTQGKNDEQLQRVFSKYNLFRLLK